MANVRESEVLAADYVMDWSACRRARYLESRQMPELTRVLHHRKWASVSSRDLPECSLAWA